MNYLNLNKKKLLEEKETILKKYKKLKKSVYEDWKLGDISKDDYLEYKKSYEKIIQDISLNIECLERETEKYKEQVLGDNIWIENLKKKKNIESWSEENVIY